MDLRRSRRREIAVEAPHEFKHPLSTVLHGTIGAGLEVRGLWEDARSDRSAKPGSWLHFTTHGALWLTVWSHAPLTPSR